jgi:hypothetical protein
MTKSSSKKPGRKLRHRKTAPEVVTEKTRSPNHDTASKVIAEKARDAYRKMEPLSEKMRIADRVTPDQFEESGPAQVPPSMRALTERNITQTRELYQRWKDAVHGVFASWERSLGSAGDGYVSFNRKFLDITDRNINSGFDLAMDLAGATNLAEAMELQATFWRKQLSQLTIQVEEVGVLSTKVAAEVGKPAKTEGTRSK